MTETETLKTRSASSIRPSAGVTGDSLPLPLRGHSAARPQPAVRRRRRDPLWPSLGTRLVGLCLGPFFARSQEIPALGAAAEASEPLLDEDTHEGKSQGQGISWSCGASSDVSVTPLLTRAAKHHGPKCDGSDHRISSQVLRCYRDTVRRSVPEPSPQTPKPSSAAISPAWPGKSAPSTARNTMRPHLHTLRHGVLTSASEEVFCVVPSKIFQAAVLLRIVEPGSPHAPDRGICGVV